MSRKLIVNDGKRQREMLLVGTMVVGRDPSCDISEADPLLSRRHVEFVSSASEVVVRDLGSRNGILINGVKTTQGILRDGDMVQVGHLQIAFAEDTAPISASLKPVDPDATALVAPSRTTAGAPPPPPRPPISPSDLATMAVPGVRAVTPTAAAPPPSIDDTEKTRFFPPPVAAPPPPAEKLVAPPVASDDDKTRISPPPTPPAARPARPPAPPVASDDDDKTRVSPPPTPPAARPARPPAPAVASDDDDKTRVSPPPTPPAARPVRPPAPAVASDDDDKTRFSPAPAAPPRSRAVESEPAATPRVAKGSWTSFVLAQVAALAATVFLATVIPLMLWQQRVLNATASSRASALTNWLASSARSGFEAGNPGAVANAADEIAREPGVVSALILSPDGRVLAPSSRSTETVPALPGLALKPGEVSTLRQSWNGELLESVRPVAAGDRSDAAIAWITYRPERPPEAGNGAVVLAISVIIAIVAAWFSSRLITRRTMRALTALNEDIELAVGGRLERIGDPLGAKPVRDLADVLNYLTVKLRGGASLDAAARSASASEPAASRAPAAVPMKAAHTETGAKRLDARIVANAQFRVTEASHDCADLIGVRPDALVGQHLIDAIPDRDIADAVLQGLSALGSSGEHRTTVSPGARGYDVSIVVSREGKDKPLTIVLSRDAEVTV